MRAPTSPTLAATTLDPFARDESPLDIHIARGRATCVTTGLRSPRAIRALQRLDRATHTHSKFDDVRANKSHGGQVPLGNLSELDASCSQRCCPRVTHMSRNTRMSIVHMYLGVAESPLGPAPHRPLLAQQMPVAEIVLGQGLLRGHVSTQAGATF